MTFKLPMQNKFSLNRTRFIHSNEEAAPGTPIIRKNLGKDILGEANIDGSIFINDKIEPGSNQEKSTLMHEMQHMTDMKTGKLSYTDDAVVFNGISYERLPKGKILFEGKKYNEGDPRLPWEKRAM
tara:strand:- start:2121 stop:2498 length:378 start_codon:yes stop_codon:yes gene_type:complete